MSESYTTVDIHETPSSGRSFASTALLHTSRRALRVLGLRSLLGLLISNEEGRRWFKKYNYELPAHHRQDTVKVNVPIRLEETLLEERGIALQCCTASRRLEIVRKFKLRCHSSAKMVDVLLLLFSGLNAQENIDRSCEAWYNPLLDVNNISDHPSSDKSWNP
jgi:hypothetical protein